MQIKDNVTVYRCDYCNKLKAYMYPITIQKKGLPERYPEQFEDQIPFKKECEFCSHGGE